MVQEEISRLHRLELEVQSQNIRQNWRIVGAAVFEIEGPFDGRKIPILDGLTANLQARKAVGPGKPMLDSRRIQAARGAVQKGGLKQFR